MEAATAVALDPDVVDDHRRCPGRPREFDPPPFLAAEAIKAEDIAAVGRHDQKIIVEARRRPDPGVESRPLLDPPEQRLLGILGRVELDDLADLTAPGIAALVFDAGIDHSLVVDDERGVDVVPGPVPEHLGGFATVGEVGDVPALDEATAVGEVDDVARDGDRTLDRHIATDVSQEFVVPAGRVEHKFWLDGDEAVGVVATVELHNVKLAVLATDEQEIVEDQSGTVPVVVPPGWRDIERVQRPEFGQFVTVEGDDPVVVVPTARVEQRESVGVDCHRALDDVARAKVGEQPFAGVVVEDVDVTAVGAEGDPCLLAALPDRRLSSPAGAAPVDDLLADRRVGAHRLVGEPPSDLGSSWYRSLAVVRARRVPPEGEQPLDGFAVRHARGTGVDPALVRRFGGGRRGGAGGRRRRGRGRRDAGGGGRGGRDTGGVVVLTGWRWGGDQHTDEGDREGETDEGETRRPRGA